MTTSIEPKVVRDLIDTKIRVLDRKIRTILRKWKVETVEQLINGARTGEIAEAESDAIELENLVAKRDEATGLYKKL